jgi:DNA invertase Pin-like site-specific DNA recombinase
MRVALYARVSTKDKEQNPETQLYGLREYVKCRGWLSVVEYVDQASAVNLRERTAWRELLEHIRKGGIDLVLVTKLDRAFRSAKDTEPRR